MLPCLFGLICLFLNFDRKKDDNPFIRVVSLAKKKTRFGPNRSVANMREMDNLIFTVGEAVRSPCGNSHEEKEEKKDRFLLSLLQTI